MSGGCSGTCRQGRAPCDCARDGTDAWPSWASFGLCAAGLVIGFIGSVFHPGVWFQ